jgi:uncharacterized membrane protein
MISMHRIHFKLFVMLLMLFSACSRQPVHPAPAIEGRDAVFTVTTLKDEIPQFYTYHYQDKNISFFVFKVNEKVFSFFDACASCYPHKQGYKYEDGMVVCRACNMQFPVYRLEKGIGGCYPIRLEGRVENGEYHIPLAVLEAEADKF